MLLYLRRELLDELLGIDSGLLGGALVQVRITIDRNSVEKVGLRNSPCNEVYDRAAVQRARPRLPADPARFKLKILRRIEEAPHHSRTNVNLVQE